MGDPGRTDALTAVRHGGRAELDLLVPAIYQELRAAAHRALRVQLDAQAGTPTFNTTALVNEAYLKLVDQSRATWRDRSHFVSLAAVAMRHILVDRARARVAGKRGGGTTRVTLDEEILAPQAQAEILLELDEALHALETLSPRLSRVVEARFFGGLSEEETATALGVTVRTVQRDWSKARMLLRRALQA